MPVQPIRSTDGQVVGYQARVGAASKYFSTAKHGGPELAHALARRVERSLRRAAPPAAPRALQANNRSGVNGIRALHLQCAGYWVLYIQASWRQRGRARSTWYSTQKHGLLGAVQLAVAARERGTRQPLGLSPRQVLARIQRSLES